MPWLFFQANHMPIGVEFRNSVALWVADPVPEHGGLCPCSAAVRS